MLYFIPGVGSASQLLDRSESRSEDRLSLLQQKIADLLETDSSNVNIISVRDAADMLGSVDVTYAAHGSPYYTPEKLNTIISMNGQEVSYSCILMQISMKSRTALNTIEYNKNKQESK